MKSSSRSNASYTASSRNLDSNTNCLIAPKVSYKDGGKTTVNSDNFKVV